MEIWQPVVGFPQYVVSPEGLIRNKDKPTPKSTRLNNQGDLIIDLSRGDKAYTRKVSLLVAQAYLGNPPNEAFNSVIQLDGDRSNCFASNLAWRPRWFVVEYNRMFNTPPLNVSVYIEETGEVFGTLRDACVKYGIVEATAYQNMVNNDSIFPQGFHLQMLQ
ncbi:HNH endonuclease [Gordonia phage Secretariat]|uniref:HNH endonuclease n=1 Tax=Gordonia phage Secretariat TaxID=2725616 RepID=A0A6M3SUP3_9CAUD|nr:HNH endonuclease [Gordonia phage Secretariat]QJD49655.1 HNH endonuclease [Gordonia phage Secretariat]